MNNPYKKTKRVEFGEMQEIKDIGLGLERKVESEIVLFPRRNVAKFSSDFSLDRIFQTPIDSSLISGAGPLGENKKTSVSIDNKKTSVSIDIDSSSFDNNVYERVKIKFEILSKFQNSFFYTNHENTLLLNPLILKSAKTAKTETVANDNLTTSAKTKRSMAFLNYSERYNRKRNTIVKPIPEILEILHLDGGNLYPAEIISNQKRVKSVKIDFVLNDIVNDAALKENSSGNGQGNNDGVESIKDKGKDSDQDQDQDDVVEGLSDEEDDDYAVDYYDEDMDVLGSDGGGVDD